MNRIDGMNHDSDNSNPYNQNSLGNGPKSKKKSLIVIILISALISAIIMVGLCFGIVKYNDKLSANESNDSSNNIGTQEKTYEARTDSGNDEVDEMNNETTSVIDENDSSDDSSDYENSKSDSDNMRIVVSRVEYEAELEMGAKEKKVIELEYDPNNSIVTETGYDLRIDDLYHPEYDFYGLTYYFLPAYYINDVTSQFAHFKNDSEETYYTYDEDGRPVFGEYGDYHSGDITYELTYEYDENGLVKNICKISKVGTHGERWEYKYNSLNLVSSVSIFDINTDAQTGGYYYTYDGIGRLILIEGDNRYNSDGNRYYETYGYSDDGIVKMYSGTVNSPSTIYYYDRNGLCYKKEFPEYSISFIYQYSYIDEFGNTGDIVEFEYY